jgi:hypothetical protein
MQFDYDRLRYNWQMLPKHIRHHIVLAAAVYGSVIGCIILGFALEYGIVFTPWLVFHR